jgi:tetratricopeptide (TPR) repeat protein
LTIMTTTTSDDNNNSSSSKGIAGRTDYSTWSRRASDLTKQLDLEEEAERSSAAAACGLDGKHAFSRSEAEERTKAKQVKQAKKALDAYKKREGGVIQSLTGLLGEEFKVWNDKQDIDGDAAAGTGTTSSSVVAAAAAAQDASRIESSQREVKYVTRDMIDAGKRVVSICDTSGPGKIVLTQDLSNLESVVPSSAPSSSQLQPKSYKDDAENEVIEPLTSTVHSEEKRIARGIIKLILRNLHHCTVIIKCKIITGTVEVSHCTNVTVVAEGSDATVATIQADMCENLDIQFRDSPSGKNVTSLSSSTPTLYWGQDASDRVFHAGVSSMRIATYRDGYIDLETKGIDYLIDGAKAVGNATAEEVQFVTSVIDGEFVTEKVISGRNVGGSFPMTEREVKVAEKKKEKIHAALDEKMKDVIQIKESSPSSSLHDSNIQETEAASINNNDEIIEEIYASATKDEVDAIIKSINDEKAKGNEAFTAGEYAQAILHYTIALDCAAELPDATAVNEWLTSATTPFATTTSTQTTKSSDKITQLFDRHIILSNRSACFLKLGHHDKALKDGTDAETLDPTYVKGVFRKGLALHAMGRYEEAIKSLSSAQRIEPKNAQIKQALQFAEVRMTQEMRKRMQG